MKTSLTLFLLSALLCTPVTQAAEAAKTYQVTGPIVELTDKTIVIQKGDEKWEVARDTNVKSDGSLKVGAKVTVHYRMHATRVDTKNNTAK